MISNLVPKKTIQFFYNLVIDLIYPPYCIFCLSLLEQGKELVCTFCWEGLPAFPADHNIEHELASKFDTSFYISTIKSVWKFEHNLQTIIYQFKYNHFIWLATKIGYYMADLIQKNQCFNNVNLIIPIPLHKRRQRERGYNQSELIGDAISRKINVVVDQKSLQRIKYTVSQTKLSASQRQQNVIDAFRVIDSKQINNKSILLIDDVITTGATMNACAKQLIQNGAKEIFAISAAKA